MDVLYHLHGIHHGYGGEFALQIPDLQLLSGESVALVGPNGSGKSTMLRLLAFLEEPQRGSILFQGMDSRQHMSSLRRHVTLMLQEPYLLRRSVFENIAYGLKIRKEDRETIERDVRDALCWVGLEPEEFLNRPWNALSTGEAQRVALAARLAIKPKVLLMDEPTSNVDAQSAVKIQQASIMAKERWGTTLIIASHDLPWVQTATNRIIHLFNGRIVGSGWENIIFGPWERHGEGLFAKRLVDGQLIYANAPVGSNSVGLINPSKIQVTTDNISQSRIPNSLFGIVSQMTLNKDHTILIHVTVGELVMTTLVDPMRMGDLSLRPGQRVRLIFDPSSIEWM
jgi:tungstate transport system ATP-binding protein